MMELCFRGISLAAFQHGGEQLLLSAQASSTAPHSCAEYCDLRLQTVDLGRRIILDTYSTYTMYRTTAVKFPFTHTAMSSDVPLLFIADV